MSKQKIRLAQQLAASGRVKEAEAVMAEVFGERTKRRKPSGCCRGRIR